MLWRNLHIDDQTSASREQKKAPCAARTDPSCGKHKTMELTYMNFEQRDMVVCLHNKASFGGMRPNRRAPAHERTTSRNMADVPMLRLMIHFSFNLWSSRERSSPTRGEAFRPYTSAGTCARTCPSSSSASPSSHRSAAP